LQSNDRCQLLYGEARKLCVRALWNRGLGAVLQLPIKRKQLVLPMNLDGTRLISTFCYGRAFLSRASLSHAARLAPAS
jgi:hypothetical protein